MFFYLAYPAGAQVTLRKGKVPAAGLSGVKCRATFFNNLFRSYNNQKMYRQSIRSYHEVVQEMGLAANRSRN